MVINLNFVILKIYHEFLIKFSKQFRLNKSHRREKIKLFDSFVYDFKD